MLIKTLRPILKDTFFRDLAVGARFLLIDKDQSSIECRKTIPISVVIENYFDMIGSFSIIVETNARAVSELQVHVATYVDDDCLTIQIVE